MYAGQLVEQRTSSQLHDDPLHPYTRRRWSAARPEHRRRRSARLAAIPGRPRSAFEAPAGCAFADRCAARRGRLPARRVRCSRHSRTDSSAAVAPRSCVDAAAPVPMVADGGIGRAIGATDRRRCSRCADCRKTFGATVAVDDVSFDDRRRRLARDRRRVGVGQDHGREDDRRAARTDLGHDHGLRPRPVDAGPCGSGASAAWRRGADRLPGSVHQPRPAPERCPAIDEVLALHRGARRRERSAPRRRTRRPRRPRPAPDEGDAARRCRAASGSGSRSHAPWRPSRACSSSTSRSPHSTCRSRRRC